MVDQAAALAEIILLPLQQAIPQALRPRKEVMAARHQHLPQITAAVVAAVHPPLVQMEPARLAAMAALALHPQFQVAV